MQGNVRGATSQCARATVGVETKVYSAAWWFPTAHIPAGLLGFVGLTPAPPLFASHAACRDEAERVADAQRRHAAAREERAAAEAAARAAALQSALDACSGKLGGAEGRARAAAAAAADAAARVRVRDCCTISAVRCQGQRCPACEPQCKAATACCVCSAFPGAPFHTLDGQSHGHL